MPASAEGFGRRQLTLAEQLTRLIHASGPISIAHYMGEANSHYYGSRDPLGAAGDFITAPEVSQMFGELLGLCLADMWIRAGSKPKVHYVELGPGRGTLARDALRAMERVGLTPQVHFVETSEALRARQRDVLPQARFHDSIDSLPENGPLLVVANEFFDALPIRQLERTPEGWRERVVVVRPDAAGRAFLPVAGPRAMDVAVPDTLFDSPVGSILETSPASAAIGFELARRLHRQGGAALVIDYGYSGPALGDTLQAVCRHQFTDPFDEVGECDLTAHVDFGTLAAVAQQAGTQVSGPVEQGQILLALGLDARAHSLCRANPDRTFEIMGARERLVERNQMGALFKTLAITAPDWPEPEGFA